MTRVPIRLLLIDPGSSRTEVNEPIGIGALTSHLRRYLGERIHVRQAFLQMRGPLRDDELAWADIVGFSMRLGALDATVELGERLRSIEASSRSALILGDLIATFATSQVLAALPEAVCVLGEGEEALRGIVDSFAASPEPDPLRRELLRRNVPNLVFLDRGIERRTLRSLIDLSASPAPDRSFAQAVGERGGIVRAEGSRGCAWGRCTFCAVQYKYCDIWPSKAAWGITELCFFGVEGHQHSNPLKRIQFVNGVGGTARMPRSLSWTRIPPPARALAGAATNPCHHPSRS